MSIRFGAGPPAPARPRRLARHLDAISHAATTVLGVIILGGLL